jgi:hypothetical protein
MGGSASWLTKLLSRVKTRLITGAIVMLPTYIGSAELLYASITILSFLDYLTWL